MVNIIGLVLMFVAVKYISEETKDQSIYKNYLWYLIFSIIAVVALLAIIPIIIGGSLLTLTNISNLNPSGIIDALGGTIIACVIALIIAYIFYLLSAIYFKKSYTSIADHTKVDLFRTTGLVYLIGAVTVIIGIGIFIVAIARILELISFLMLPDALPAGSMQGQMESTASSRRCPNCGRLIPEDARICPYCSKNFEM
ncbi:MAG: DUF996 domain-containing protein [Candidatus Thermoplasmatota archaeon]